VARQSDGHTLLLPSMESKSANRPISEIFGLLRPGRSLKRWRFIRELLAALCRKPAFANTFDLTGAEIPHSLSQPHVPIKKSAHGQSDGQMVEIRDLKT